MAFDSKPPSWIASMSEDGTDITIPLASLPGLAAAEADATTGDIRKVAYRLLDRLFAVYADLPDADKPAYMVMRKNSRTNPDGNNTHEYTVTFVTAGTSDQEVIAEPT